MDFKVDMLYSRGYELNQFIISGNKKIKVPVIDPEIEDWLESWDAIDYIIDQFTDFVWNGEYLHTNGCEQNQKGSSNYKAATHQHGRVSPGNYE